MKTKEKIVTQGTRIGLVKMRALVNRYSWACVAQSLTVRLLSWLNCCSNSEGFKVSPFHTYGFCLVKPAVTESPYWFWQIRHFAGHNCDVRYVPQLGEVLTSLPQKIVFLFNFRIILRVYIWGFLMCGLQVGNYPVYPQFVLSMYPMVPYFFRLSKMCWLTPDVRWTSPIPLFPASVDFI